MATGFKSNTIIQEAKDLSKYGKEFQIKLLALLIKDRTFTFSILPIIKDLYFSDIYLRVIFSAIKEYSEQYYTTPSFDNLKIILQSQGEKLVIYDKILKQIDEIELEDRDFVITNTRNFCFTKHALTESEKMIIALKEGKLEIAKKISMEAFQYSGLQTAKILDLKKDIEKVHQHKAQRTPMPSVFDTFNKNSQGGLSGGEICIIVAPSNFGKSNYLVSMARHLNYIGKNVVFFSYEMSSESLIEKYMAGLLDIPQDEVKNYRKEISERLKDPNLGELRIIEDKAANATVSGVKGHIEYLKSMSFFPDAIIVDGLNQLKLEHGVRARDDNEKFETIVEDFKDMCKEESLPAWLCWQTNRSGFSEEINGINSIGKAVEVFQKADQVITFSQAETMKANNECIAFLLKNRLGQKEIALLVQYDPAKVLFVEKEIINHRVLLSDSAKKKVANTVSGVREKLKIGEFDKK